LVTGTIDKYHWVQLGAAVNHPEKCKEIDLGEDMRKLTGVKDASLKIIPWKPLQYLMTFLNHPIAIEFFSFLPLCNLYYFF